MANLGVHFAITQEETQMLKDISDDRDRKYWLQDNIEPVYLEKKIDHFVESEKSWWLIHQILVSPGVLAIDKDNMLGLVIMGGEQLYLSDKTYHISLKMHSLIYDISDSLYLITSNIFLDNFNKTIKALKCDIAPELSNYTLEYFNEIKKFYLNHISSNRNIIFTVDL